MEVNYCRLSAPLPQHYSPSPLCSDVGVLLVDSDVPNLINLKWMFHQCGYNNVSYVQSTEDALWLLQHTAIDILVSSVDVGGFQLLSAVRQDLFFNSVQVVLFSNHNVQNGGLLGHEIAIRALELGACAFYWNPISMEVVRHLWQHVFIKKIQSCNQIAPISTNLGPTYCSTLTDEAEVTKVQKKKKKKRDDDDDGEMSGKLIKRKKRMGSAAKAKQRMRWTEDLEKKFAAAVDAIDEQEVTASRILRLMKGMGEEALTLPQISSHLQQFQKNRCSTAAAAAGDHQTTSSLQVGSAADGSTSSDSVAADHHNNTSPEQQQIQEQHQVGAAWSDADIEELMITVGISDVGQLLLSY